MTIVKWVILTAINIRLIVVLSRHEQSEMGRTGEIVRNSNRIVWACISLYTIAQIPNVVLRCLLIGEEPVQYESFTMRLITVFSQRMTLLAGHTLMDGPTTSLSQSFSASS